MLSEATELLHEGRRQLATAVAQCLQSQTTQLQGLFPSEYEWMLRPVGSRDADRLATEVWAKGAQYGQLWSKVKPLDKALQGLGRAIGSLGEEGRTIVVPVQAEAMAAVNSAHRFSASVCILNIVCNKAQRASDPTVRASIKDMHSFIKNKAPPAVVPSCSAAHRSLQPRCSGEAQECA